MLILTRRIGESILIGDDVKVAIMDVQGMHVRLGIDAPREVEVHREEIYKRIQEERAGTKPTEPLPSHKKVDPPMPKSNGNRPVLHLRRNGNG